MEVNAEPGEEWKRGCTNEPDQQFFPCPSARCTSPLRSRSTSISTSDGETVRKVEITSGHVHRGMEGMATQRNFFKNTTLTERVCSLCSNSHSLTYCMAVENVLGMTPPPRAHVPARAGGGNQARGLAPVQHRHFRAQRGFKSLFLHIMEVRENMQDVRRPSTATA